MSFAQYVLLALVSAVWNSFAFVGFYRKELVLEPHSQAGQLLVKDLIKAFRGAGVLVGLAVATFIWIYDVGATVSYLVCLVLTPVVVGLVRILESYSSIGAREK